MPAIVKQKQLRTGDLEFSSTTASDVDQYLVTVDSRITKVQMGDLWVAVGTNPKPQQTLKQLGTAYMICDRIRCRQEPNQGFIWHIDVYWKELSTSEPQQQTFAVPNSATVDSDLWIPNWSKRTVTVFERSGRAFYKSGYSGKADTKVKGEQAASPDKRAALQNSALQPFADTPDHRRRYNIWNFRWLRKTVPAGLVSAEGKINSEDFNVVTGYAHTWKKQTALIDSVNLSPVRWGALALIEISVEVIQDDQGFLWQIADRGTARRALPGDFDESGNVIPGTTGGAFLRQIVDSNGRAIQDPVWLDGNGQPKPETFDPKFGTWSDFEEVDFNSVPLLMSV